jgi:hypothetical protein
MHHVVNLFSLKLIDKTLVFLVNGKFRLLRWTNQRFVDVDILHAKRNHLVGCSYLDIIDILKSEDQRHLGHVPLPPAHVRTLISPAVGDK